VCVFRVYCPYAAVGYDRHYSRGPVLFTQAVSKPAFARDSLGWEEGSCLTLTSSSPVYIRGLGDLAVFQTSSNDYLDLGKTLWRKPRSDYRKLVLKQGPLLPSHCQLSALSHRAARSLQPRRLPCADSGRRPLLRSIPPHQFVVNGRPG